MEGAGNQADAIIIASPFFSFQRFGARPTLIIGGLMSSIGSILLYLAATGKIEVQLLASRGSYHLTCLSLDSQFDCRVCIQFSLSTRIHMGIPHRRGHYSPVLPHL